MLAVSQWRDIPKFDTCFVCGPKNEHGLGLSFRYNGDAVETEWTPAMYHCGYHGIAHGGLISAVLDEIMGWTGWDKFRGYYLTAELKVRFKRPIEAGEKYIVRARMTDVRRRVYFAEGEIVSHDDEVFAEAFGKYFIVSDVPTVKK